MTTKKKPGSEETIIEISCHEVFRALGGYLEDDLDANLRQRMKGHFKNCTHCRALVSGAQNVIQLVGDGRAFDVPEGFSTRLYGKLEQPLAKKGRV